VIRVTDTVGGRRTTPAVISPCSGTALTRLISRSTPYLTFLQHQHLLSVSALGRSRLDGPPVDRPDRPASPGRTGSLKLPAERLPKARVPGPETRDGLTALAAGAAIRPYPVPGGKRVSSCDRAPGLSVIVGQNPVITGVLAHDDPRSPYRGAGVVTEAIHRTATAIADRNPRETRRRHRMHPHGQRVC
jgi:hypothetical protein